MRGDYFDMTRRAQRLYTQLLEPLCAAHSVSRSELDVLLFLHNNPEFDRAADIVAHRGMVKSQVSASVANLEERGLLVRRADAEDRRTVHLSLTETAAEIARAGQALQREFFAGLFAGIPQEELLAWERLIQNINFDDYESRNYFDIQLRKCGLFTRLEEMGIQDGDTVDIYDFVFEYQR